MRKIFAFTLLLASVAMLFVACEDDEVSKKHVYTEAELKLRDSLEAVKNNIKANYIITYEVDLPVDTVNYRSVEVSVDTEPLLEKLGFGSPAELTTALGTVPGTVQVDHTVDFFAINNSTRFDFTGAYTAAGHGYWFDKNGDVTNWNNNDAVFVEFNPETFVFSVGQHPKNIKPGDTFKTIIVMQKGEYRVGFVLNIHAGDYYKEEQPKAVNVATVELTVEAAPDNDYIPADLPFDFAAAAEAMGIGESELEANQTFYGINSDDSMTANYTADAGYWYTKDGDVTQWGTPGCAVYVNYETGMFHIGQYPDACEPGDEFTVAVAVMYKNTKMVTYLITVKIVE